MTTEERYVAAVYLVVLLFVFAYVVLMAARSQRLGRDVAELTSWRARKRAGEEPVGSRRRSR